MASEINAAAERVIRKDRPHEDYWMQSDHDEYAVAVWARSRLAADRAERDERERPIDAEWLQSLPGDWAWAPSYGLISGSGIAITDIHGGTWVCHGIRVANRGDVLDLLRVLKGGAE